MTESAPTPPQLHFPSPYQRPRVAPRVARAVETADGASIAAFVYGPAPDEGAGLTPVLFLHGNGEEHGIFGPQVDAVVAGGRSAVCIDSRAQGASTRGHERLSYELLASDALAVLDALGVDRVHVAGFSDGAIEALILARDCPERVASVLSMGANLSPEGVIPEEDWDVEGTARIAEDWARWLESSPEGVDPSLMTPDAGSARATADLMRLMLEEPHIAPSSLASVCCPVTVMVGEFDCIDPEETERIFEALPRARKVVVAGADHNLPKRASDAVVSELLALIAQGEEGA